ncbi:sensor histidine kinase [Ktedonobacter racemifer]|uniref:histidine kinase n=1 Tax=Ktedonobacter racemifer DSM 44963 TaxID=485913 RepID=D6TYP9_KTERA|nr:ATP-binding protein [Ktedonobacter racemifer]EFH85124.1 histidine kinase [Ktedonobacter racemifer DSM 44963]
MNAIDLPDAVVISTDEMERFQRLEYEHTSLLEQRQALELRIHKSEERRRAFIHILHDMSELNKKLCDQRKAMIHILADYEQDRRSLAQQTERLDNSRRALVHILQDSHDSNLRLEKSRKAMIHIMSDLKETTEEVKRQERELLEKQEQLVQAGKLATLGELTTGVAHELNNPLNSIGLFVGNTIDMIRLGMAETETQQLLQELDNAMQQVHKATSIISHLRTFGRVASARHEPMILEPVVRGALMLLQEQLRLRQIEVHVDFPSEEVKVLGSSIQLEQVFINLLTNARDAMASSRDKRMTISCAMQKSMVELHVSDTGTGILPELEKRIFDPFFTTKEVGLGTGLGLSITYGIIQDHRGTIELKNHPGEGAVFIIRLPILEQKGDTVP